MGYIITSLCRLCNFSTDFNLGGGKFNYQTNFPVPAINKETLEFENINYFEHKDSNKYDFYSDKALQGDNTNENTINYSNLYFNQEGNLCPKCRNKSFAFRIRMFMD